MEDYSPVIIPTLCRYEHFRKCIESLQKCTYAEKTDVIIGLDYPLKDGHWEGYRKIDAFLKGVCGFRNLIIFRREQNFGSHRNIVALQEYALSKYSSFIYMEDDIEVGPCFLDYIHKGLFKFADDESVYAICGYSPLHIAFDESETFYRQDLNFSAWGYGVSKKNYIKMKMTMSRWYSIGKLLNPLALYKVIHLSWGAFLFLMMHVMNPQLLTDYVLSNYLLLEAKDVVMPNISLVRNNGFDGSGEHCVSNASFAMTELDNRPKFEFIGNGQKKRKDVLIRLRLAKRREMGFSKMCSHIKSMIWVRFKRIWWMREK